jgi:hypothetical protein
MENFGLNGYMPFLKKKWEVLGIIQGGHFLQTPHSLGCGDNRKNCGLLRIIQCTELLPSVIAVSTDTARLGSARHIFGNPALPACYLHTKSLSFIICLLPTESIFVYKF